MKQAQSQKEKKAHVSLHRQFQGDVVSASGNKTIHVLIKAVKIHPKYRKQFVMTKKYAVHDEKGQAVVGNTVLFEECRPLSKTKRWRLVRVVSKKTLGTVIE